MLIKSFLISIGFVFVLNNTSYAQYEIQPGDRIEYFNRLLQITDYNASGSSFLIRPVHFDTSDTKNSPYRLNGRGNAEDFIPIFEYFKWGNLKLYDPEFAQSINSHLPRGVNDGAQWQGRGYNNAFSIGVHGSIGILHAKFRPVFGFTQNYDFNTGPYPAPRGEPYTYPWRNFDHVQRFGDKPFTWFDLGDSFLQLRYHGLKMGFSNSRIWSGPAVYNPLLHSYNAGGFKHFVLGTYRPLKSIIGNFEFQYHFGALEESDYFDSNSTNNRTSNLSLIGVYSPSFIKGFSIGLHRTYIDDYPDSSEELYRQATKVFDAFLKYKIIEDDDANRAQPDNQIATVFFRWISREHGFELYGEFGRNDHNADFRDARAQYDHDSAWLFGVIKTVELSKLRLLSIGYETTQLDGTRSSYTRGTGNTPANPNNLGITGRWYAHRNRNDFTHRGQVLGAGIGSGSNSNTIKIDLFESNRSFGLRIARMVYGNGLLNYQQTYDIILAQNEPDVKRHELRNTEILVGLDATFKLLYGFEVSTTLEQSYIMNHLYLKNNDFWNTRIEVILRKRLNAVGSGKNFLRGIGL